MRQERKGDIRGLVTPEVLWYEKNADTRKALAREKKGDGRR
jgi:hypothetical protein